METLEYWENGKLLKTIHPDPQVGHLGIHVPQAHLLKAIIDEGNNNIRDFTLMTNTKVTELLQDDDRSHLLVSKHCVKGKNYD